MNKVLDKSTGYHYIWCPEHPNAKQNGNVAYHRYVMSKFLNRALKKSEMVHHKDKNKLNNNINNLELISRSEHVYKHKKRKKIINCTICNKKTNNLKYCSIKCNSMSQRRVKRPSNKKLKLLLKKYPCTKVANMYGVSDRAIKKWLIKRQ